MTSWVLSMASSYLLSFQKYILDRPTSLHPTAITLVQATITSWLDVPKASKLDFLLPVQPCLPTSIIYLAGRASFTSTDELIHHLSDLSGPPIPH